MAHQFVHFTTVPLVFTERRYVLYLENGILVQYIDVQSFMLPTVRFHRGWCDLPGKAHGAHVHHSRNDGGVKLRV